MKEIIIATKNKGKIAEFEALFKVYGVKVLSLYDFTGSNLDVEETGTTFVENAQLKAEQIAKLMNKPVLADDSGLVVDALGGRPGVFSARYAGEPTNDEKNNEKILSELKNVPINKRQATFICVLALAIPGKATIFKTGTCHGQINDEPRGNNGFGYDPIFIPDGFTQTMAELSSEEKNKISHRNDAIQQMKVWLDNTIEKVL